MSCSKSRYKSKKDKGSILADVKNLLLFDIVIIPVMSDTIVYCSVNKFLGVISLCGRVCQSYIPYGIYLVVTLAILFIFSCGFVLKIACTLPDIVGIQMLYSISRNR